MIKELADRDAHGGVLIFENPSSRPIDLNLRGTVEEVVSRLPDEAPTVSSKTDSSQDTPKKTPRGPGRPKLGVVGREVTLLPRHWQWLGEQPGGASVTLRKLVEKARLAGAAEQPARQAKESAYRFMSAIAGDEQGFEEATRALFAGNAEAFAEHTETWPVDIRIHAREIAAPALRSK